MAASLLRYLFLFITLFTLQTITTASATANERVFTIARAPQLSITKTEKAWSPYIQYLNESTNSQFVLKLYDDRDLFERDIQKGVVDFYFGNPGYGVVGHLNHDYLPIIRSNNKKLQGIIVVREDSDLKRVTDLQNKKLVFPGKTAFAASLLIRHFLGLHYDLSFDEGYVVGHDNVYRNVLNGNYVAGGGVYKTLNREPEGLRNQLRVIYKTPGVSSHPFMVHPSVPGYVKKLVVSNTLLLNKTEKGKKILKKIKLSKPVVTDYKKDYSSLEPLVKKVYKYLLIE